MPEPGEKPLRLFAAADLPPRALDVVDAASNAWRERLGGSERWVHRDNQHVTVAFLGRTWPHQVDWVRGRLAAACARVRPFEAGLQAFGVFPSVASARVLWLGLDERGGGWDALAARVSEELAAEFPARKRHYTPT